MARSACLALVLWLVCHLTGSQAQYPPDNGVLVYDVTCSDIPALTGQYVHQPGVGAGTYKFFTGSEYFYLQHYGDGKWLLYSATNGMQMISTQVVATADLLTTMTLNDNTNTNLPVNSAVTLTITIINRQCSASVTCTEMNKHVDTTLPCASATSCGQECCVDNLCSFADAAANHYEAFTCNTASGNLATGACILVCRAGFKGSATATCSTHGTPFAVTENCVVADDIIAIANPTYEGRYKHVSNHPVLGEFYHCEANTKTLHRTQDTNGKLNGWTIGAGASALCAKSAVETPVNLLGHWANCLTGTAVQLSLYVYQPHVWAHRRPDGEGPFETCASFNCGTHPRRPGPTPVCPHEGCTVEHCCVDTCASFNCDVLGLKRRPNAASVTCPLHNANGDVGCNEGRCCAQTCASAIASGEFSVATQCIAGPRANLADIICHRTGCGVGRCCAALTCPSETDPTATAWTDWCASAQTSLIPDITLAGTRTADQTQRVPADCCKTQFCKDVTGMTCDNRKVWNTISLTLRCSDAACGDNDANCCEKQMCGDVEAQYRGCSDLKQWSTSTTLQCEHAPCETDDDTCCEKQMCNDPTLAGKTCTDTTKHWDRSTPTLRCQGAPCGDDDNNCCQPNPYCSATTVSCSALNTHINSSQQCAGATCTPLECCVANPYCPANPTCSATQHAKGTNQQCSGATCGAECCTDNDKCNDATSLFKSDLLCRQTVVYTHLKTPVGGFTPCTSLHCSHSECCEANPTCHGTTQEFCGDHWHLNNNLDHITCLTGSCTVPECCWANPTCNQQRYNTAAQCAAHNKVLADNLDTPCTTTTCDDTDCCQVPIVE